MAHSHPCDALSIPVCKMVREYQLPGAAQTHEMAFVSKQDIGTEEDVLIISQQFPSRLLKMKLNPITGQPLCVHSFSIGSAYSGIHGLAASQKYKGCVWVTLQFDNALVLVDASKDSEADFVRKKILLPISVYGPHGVVENGEMIWASCKESHHVVSVNSTTGVVDHISEAGGKPIFVAVHPISKDVYASIIDSSQLLRIPAKGDAAHISIPKSKGSGPVSIVSGPDDNLWFTLLSSGGSDGTFGCILKNGRLVWFSLQAMKDQKISLLHLAFDTYNKGQNKIKIWLLSSTVASKSAIDAIFSVDLEVKDLSKTTTPVIVPKDVIFLSSYASGTHRVLRHTTGLFVTELSVSILAHVSGDGVGMGRNSKQLNCGCSCNGAGRCSCKFNGDCGCPLSCSCKSDRDAFQYVLT